MIISFSSGTFSKAHAGGRCTQR